MSARTRLELFGIAVVVLIGVAFIASFIFGLRSSGPRLDATNAAAPIETPPLMHAGRVEVLNASGRSGMARAATDRLRSGGFDVVFYGTASGAPRDSSVVLARTSSSDGVARAAARRLEIARVQTQIDTSLYVDATVILGKDWPREEVAVQREERLRDKLLNWLR